MATPEDKRIDPIGHELAIGHVDTSELDLFTTGPGNATPTGDPGVGETQIGREWGAPSGRPPAPRRWEELVDSCHGGALTN